MHRVWKKVSILQYGEVEKQGERRRGIVKMVVKKVVPPA